MRGSYLVRVHFLLLVDLPLLTVLSCKGISVGWFLTFGQVYINEAAPAHLRGIVFAVYQTQLSIGSVIGAAVDYGTHNIEDKSAYRIPLALFFIAPTVQSISLIFFPESPRWLMAHGREDSAELALRKLRGRAIEEVTFQAELNEIRISTRQQVEHSKRKKKQLWLEIWNRSNRRRTLLSIAVVCFHCAAGGNPSKFPSTISPCFTASCVPQSWLIVGQDPPT